MEIREAYDQWAGQYDSNLNRTRDREAEALRELLEPYRFDRCLEIGCGTGKNTVWLAARSHAVVAVDFSASMLARARAKTYPSEVRFVQADVLQPWTFGDGSYDLVTFSLVLEHIEDLHRMLEHAATVLKPGGRIYIGELHPFKQYSGSKARFETAEGTRVLRCYTHSVSDYTRAAFAACLQLETLSEYSDLHEPGTLPRILAFIFRKPGN